MQDKRLKKAVEIKNRALLPTVIGDIKKAETLVITWGSNRGVLEESLDRVADEKIAGLHFAQVYPLPKDAKKLLTKKK